MLLAIYHLNSFGVKAPVEGWYKERPSSRARRVSTERANTLTMLRAYSANKGLLTEVWTLT